MVGGIKVSGTDLNRSMTTDLATASKLYVEETKEGLLGGIVSIVKGVLTLDIDKILSAIGGIMDMGIELIGSIKDRLLAFIYSLLGRDSSGLSKLSVTERSEVESADDCGFNLSGSLDGMNLSLVGYGIASFLAMLLCAGIKGIFALIDGVINIGLATVSLVVGAISDVLKFIVGGNTLQVVNDLGKSSYADKLSAGFNNPAPMLLDAVGKNTTKILEPVKEFDTLVSGMNKMAPNWLREGANFNLSNIKGNEVVSSLANSVNLSKIAAPITDGYNLAKTFNPSEKISMFSKGLKTKFA